MNTIDLIASCACYTRARGRFCLKLCRAPALALEAKVNQHLAKMGFVWN